MLLAVAAFGITACPQQIVGHTIAIQAGPIPCLPPPGPIPYLPPLVWRAGKGRTWFVMCRMLLNFHYCSLYKSSQNLSWLRDRCALYNACAGDSQRWGRAARDDRAMMSTNSLIYACKLSWPLVQIQMPQKLPEAAVMSHNIKRHCEALLTV